MVDVHRLAGERLQLVRRSVKYRVRMGQSENKYKPRRYGSCVGPTASRATATVRRRSRLVMPKNSSLIERSRK